MESLGGEQQEMNIENFFGGRGPNLIPILVFYRIMYSVQVTPLMFNLNI